MLRRHHLTALVTTALLAGSAHAQAASHKTSFTADLSYVSSSGNSKFATFSVGDRIVHTRGPWTFSQVAGFVNSKNDSTTTANAFRISGRADRALRANVAVFASVADERNTFAGFRSRADEAAGLAWQVIHSPTDSVAVDEGAVYTEETNVDGTKTNYASGRTALTYKHVFSKSAYFLQFGEYVQPVQSRFGHRGNTETAVVAPVSAHIGIKASFVLRYASKPPVGFGTTDRILTMGLQIAF